MTMGLLRKSKGEKAIRYWDSRDALGRLDLVMRHCRLFGSMGLVSPSEIEMAQALSESSREYILAREDQPIFAEINLRQKLEQQRHKSKLRKALRMVFSTPKRRKSEKEVFSYSLSSSRLRLS